MSDGFKRANAGSNVVIPHYNHAEIMEDLVKTKKELGKNQ
jgi:hypothetical protein